MKIEFLEKKISYIFENKNIIKRALTHKSTGLSEHNEQYEFLGDRVLGLIISEILILKYIDLVCTNCLSKSCLSYGVY